MTAVRIGDIAEMMGLSVSRVRQLADAGIIPHETTAGGHRVFNPALIAARIGIIELAGARALGAPDFDARYSLEGLAEHEVWRQFRDGLGLAEAPALHLLEFALEEMVNNAVSHSAGTSLRVLGWASSAWLAFCIVDDGIGALERLRSEHGLPDHLSSIQELSKGKRTTNPEEHTGLGIFFTSKALDRFVLVANGWQWTVDALIGDQTVKKAPATAGTVIAGIVAADTTRTMREVFTPFTPDGSFSRTTPSVKLVTYGTRLVSRSEAKLITEGLEQFREVDMDFAGVETVGQGFVDEVFRVWARRHSEVQLRPINMNDAVTFMVERGLPGALQ